MIARVKIERRRKGKMVHGSEPIIRKIIEKSVIKHYPESRLGKLMEGEFFNLRQRMNPSIYDESPIKKGPFPPLGSLMLGIDIS
jgi:hypothetical protein